MAGARPFVLDTTVLSNFASTDSITLVAELIDRPIVVSAVRDELERRIEAGHRFPENATDACNRGIEIVVPDDVPPIHKGELDTGERESMAVAVEIEAVLATDDLAARELARTHDVPTTGSIGVLVLGVAEECIDVETADRWLETWRDERGYYSPVGSVSDVL